ncbi:MAG TPA: TIGR03435 family protein [Vicinamibacterales bacterium]|nr:TIGR03435 family protein [Vicinamibacterales bacterium]
MGHRASNVIGLVTALCLSFVRVASLETQIPAVDSHAPAFQNVSITANMSNEPARGRINLEPGGRLTALNVTLRALLETAYRRHSFDRREISGGPSWIETDRFDVVANAPAEHVFDPDGAPRRTWLMLRRLLADHFKLKVRYDNKEQPVYALVMANENRALGPGLKSSDVDCADTMAKLIRGERPTGGPQCGFGPYPRRLVARAVTMPDLASYLSGLLKRPVLDRTSLSGNFDLEVEGIEVVPPGPPGPSTRPSNTTRSIVDTLPEQLGLKLESTTGSVEIVVVEQAEKPGQP